MNRIKTTTSTTGTGNITVSAGAAARCRPLSDIAAGRQVAMMIEDEAGSDWELSLCTILTATTFSRDAVLNGSNGGSKVNFGAGTKTVFATMDANSIDRGLSARVYHLSKMGVPNDADLAPGSTTFGVDSTAAVQAVLDLANATNPIRIVWDVKCSGTGWKIKSGTTIEAVGDCGAILRSGSNKSLFENENIRWTPATRVDKNITIKGGVWNGNRGAAGGDGHGTNNRKGNGTTGLNCLFRLYGVENLTFDPGLLICSPSYSSHVMNCKRVFSSRVRHDVGPGEIVNTDGHNTGGYCEDIVYRDLHVTAADDPLSISPDDVWGQVGSFVYPFYPVASMGPIKNVLVDNLLVQSFYYGVRLMAPTNRLDNVVIRNVTGYTKGWAILIDNYQAEGGLPGASGVGNIGAVTIDGVDIAVTAGVLGAKGAIIRITSSAEKITIRNLRRSGYGDAIPTILIEGATVSIGLLEIDGYDTNDTASSQVVSHIKVVGATVNKMHIRGLNARRSSANGSKLIDVSGGATIGALQLSAISLDNITNLLSNNGGTINRINATNITHDGGSATFATASAIPRLNLSGYIGAIPTSGTFTQTSGDGVAALPDTFPPTVMSAAVASASPSVVRLTMSENMNEANVPAASAFTVPGHAVSGVAISGLYISLTVTPAFTAGEAARAVAYTQPGTGNARDLAGNLLANFSAQAITNNVGAGTAAPLTFSTGHSSITNDGNNVWTTSQRGYPAGGYNTYGRASAQKIAANSNGFVYCQHPSGLVGIYANFGLALASSPTAQVQFGFILYENTTPLTIITGGVATTGPAEIIGNHYGVRTTGTTATLETSADGVNWTVIHTYAGASTADLYPIFYLAADAGANLYHPMGIGLA